MTREQAIAQLRHLYSLMINGHVTDTSEAARGLLGPAIETLEGYMWRDNPNLDMPSCIRCDEPVWGGRHGEGCVFARTI